MSRTAHDRLAHRIATGHRLLPSERRALDEAYNDFAPGVCDDGTFLDFFEQPRETRITSLIRVWNVAWYAIHYSGVGTIPYFECQVLDVGAGRGEMQQILHAQRVPQGSRIRYTGIELDLRKVEVFNQLSGGHGEMIVADLREGIPRPDQTFHVAISTESLEHFDEASGRFLLQEIYRVLSPGGHLILTTPDGDHWLSKHSDNPFHLYVWPNAKLRAYLTVVGFDVVDAFWMNVGIRQLASILPPRWPSRMHSDWIRATVGPTTGEKGSCQVFICRRPAKENRREKGRTIKRARR